MTEDEWLRETRPTVMLYHLVLMRTKLVLLSWIGARGDRESGRKLRLFVCACARRLWPQLSTGGREVVEACERHADGLTPASALEPLRKTMDGDPTADVLLSVALTSSPWFPFQFDRGGWVVNQALRATRVAEGCPSDADPSQCDLLRDVFTPFFKAQVEPAWLTWRNGLISTMARALYDERRFDEMPVLADALEDAGCTEAALLEHCRASKEHARGCWALDALLGRV